MDTDLKASCEYDLSFPFHQPQTATEKLASIHAFMEQQQLITEYLISGPMVEHLEEKVAALFGKPAAMWCPTGTMAQAIAARIYAGQSGTNRLLLHPTSHLLLHEHDGYQQAHALNASLVGQWRQPITAELLDGNAACAFVELPQRHSGNLLPSWNELTALKQKANQVNLPLHMDGARVWSSQTYYKNRTFAEIANGFNSIYVSLYKDIGAIGGAVLIGEQAFMAEARLWRARLGGLLIEPWPMIADALRLLDIRLEQMPGFVARAQQLAGLLVQINGIQVDPQPPHTNLFHVLLPCSSEAAEKARDAAAQATGVWLAKRFWAYEGEHQCAMEITVGEKAAAIPDDEFFNAIKIMVASIKP